MDEESYRFFKDWSDFMNTAKYVASMIEQWKASGAEKWRIVWSVALLCVDWPYVFGAWGAECTPG